MNKFIRFFSHPALGAVELLASVIGVVLAVYLYAKSTSSPSLTFHIYPVRAPVVSARQGSQLTVIYGGHEILSDITAAQIALWNAGKRPIRAEDVLTPITIRTDNSIPILEASVRKTSRDLINLAVDQSDISAGSLRITWKILEQNDGGIIQIIYAGPAETRISADGAIVGQPNVHEVKYYGSISSLAEQFVKTARIYRAMGVLMIFVAVLLTAFDAYLVLTRQRKGTLTGTIVELLWNPRLTLLENLVPLIIRIGVPLSYLYSGALLLYKSIITTAPFEF